MIFLSHNYKDKEVVGPIAIKLAEKYGKENVFYDSWSIRPGDGIINEMNLGLEKCKYFFFFISENSLNSGMVTLEWQSALHKSVKNSIKFIPIKVDNSNQPTILIDKLYIDMYNIGFNQSLQQMIDLIDNFDSNIYNSTYSNVYYEIDQVSDAEIKLIIKSKKFNEHTPTINVSFKNDIESIELKVEGAPGQKTFASTSILSSGTMSNGYNTKGIRVTSQDLTPEEPLYITVKNKYQEKITDFKVWQTQGNNCVLLNTIK